MPQFDQQGKPNSKIKQSYQTVNAPDDQVEAHILLIILDEDVDYGDQEEHKHDSVQTDEGPLRKPVVLEVVHDHNHPDPRLHEQRQREVVQKQADAVQHLARLVEG